MIATWVSAWLWPVTNKALCRLSALAIAVKLLPVVMGTPLSLMSMPPREIMDVNAPKPTMSTPSALAFSIYWDNSFWRFCLLNLIIRSGGSGQAISQPST